jgi:hypothetical protein
LKNRGRKVARYLDEERLHREFDAGSGVASEEPEAVLDAFEQHMPVTAWR